MAKVEKFRLEAVSGAANPPHLWQQLFQILQHALRGLPRIRNRCYHQIGPAHHVASSEYRGVAGLSR